MRDILLGLSMDITETVKYGMPCFCYNGKILCYLWTDKKTTYPYFLIVEGNQLNHPALESGTRKRMKTLTVNPSKDLDLELLHEVLFLALDLYRE
jgi:hypothetical protein